jgi:hypothetical protein
LRKAIRNDITDGVSVSNEETAFLLCKKTFFTRRHKGHKGTRRGFLVNSPSLAGPHGTLFISLMNQGDKMRLPHRILANEDE